VDNQDVGYNSDESGGFIIGKYIMFYFFTKYVLDDLVSLPDTDSRPVSRQSRTTGLQRTEAEIDISDVESIESENEEDENPLTALHGDNVEDIDFFRPGITL